MPQIGILGDFRNYISFRRFLFLYLIISPNFHWVLAEGNLKLFPGSPNPNSELQSVLSKSADPELTPRPFLNFSNFSTNRTDRKEVGCDPETNVYPCGSLEFLGCSGNKKFFSQSSIRLNWFEAWEYCRSHGMHLASIQSNYEQLFIELFLPKPEFGAKEGYWISGNDFGREGRFYWMNSGHSFTYTNWHPGEPNNFRGQEHCVQVTTNPPKQKQNTMKWNDVACNVVAYAICQEDYSRLKDILSTAKLS